MPESEAEFKEEFQEFFEEIMREGVAGGVEQAYELLLEKNLAYQLEEIPREMREDLAESAAEVYGEQARKIMDSTYLGQSEVGFAMATAFLDDSNKGRLALEVRSVFRQYEQDMELDFDKYEDRARTVLNEPWPPQDLGTGAERFLDKEDDPTYM